jgi:hypothetical protein
MKGFFDGPGQILHIADKVIVLRARARHADDIGFLKGIIANDACGNLTCKGHHRRRVHKGIGQASDHVCPAGT